jgi:hypothetical protein
VHGRVRGWVVRGDRSGQDPSWPPGPRGDPGPCGRYEEGGEWWTNIPPVDIFGENLGTYPQIKKSFYFWYFQMQRVIEDRIRQDDFAFIRDIWGDWSPGYQADEDMVHIREALADLDHLRAALAATTGASSIRRASARRSGRRSRRPHRAAAPRSPFCTCTGRTTAATACGRTR